MNESKDPIGIRTHSGEGQSGLKSTTQTTRPGAPSKYLYINITAFNVNRVNVIYEIAN
jgi:hypothetical protein